jgi:pimeloyl-ACP methyl ester carboxylesterase
LRRPARVLIAALALLAFSYGACAVARSVWSPARLPATVERHTARTADGWDLELLRYRPGRPLPGRRPLLLLHGIATNARNLDYDGRHSLARAMAARGLDTWAMSLRGHGGSEKPRLFGGGKRYDWDFDTYCTEDLPAALAFVRARTAAERGLQPETARVDFVGHSMGGLILYCLLARGGEPAATIGAAATLGAPLGFRWGPRFTQLARWAASAASRLPVVVLNAPTLLALPLLSWFPEPAGLLFFNPANMDPAVWSGFLAVGVDDDSPRLAAQFLRFLDADKLTSRDGGIDYEAALRAVRTPVLVVAGKADQLGFPQLVRRGFDALGGPKEWLLVGEESGAIADYGHMDLLLGDHADVDVFGPLARWFEARALLR